MTNFQQIHIFRVSAVVEYYCCLSGEAGQSINGEGIAGDLWWSSSQGQLRKLEHEQDWWETGERNIKDKVGYLLL